MTGCAPATRLTSSCCDLDCRYTQLTQITRQHSRQPETLYRELRARGTPYLQFIPLQEPDNPESVTDQQWGTFLSAVFDVWVREDIGRVFVQHFDSTLDVWCGSPPQISDFACELRKQTAVSEACRSCPVRHLCSGDCPKYWVAGKSALCAGYQAFFRHSAPHMRVMRDLIRHHRSPLELMALLRQSQ